ncbi:MAG TPA: SAM-dependent methyltransferase, partial [Candidatus Accumulibacter sp.]|nr:SAM-dependent methyltransferase [Accumulibacter sp.]
MRVTPALFHHAEALLAELLRLNFAADQVVAAYFRRNRELGHGERGFVAELVFAVLRRKRSLAARCAGDLNSRRLLLAALAC